MNLSEIEMLASRFRRGAEIAYAKGLFDERPFNDFPNACCGDATELVAQYLLDNDPSHTLRCRYIYGTYDYDDFENKFGHTWLEVNDGIIVDITANQRQFRDSKIFPQDAIVPCYVGMRNDFYSLFEENPHQSYRFCDLRCFPEEAYIRMKNIYDTIISCIP